MKLDVLVSTMHDKVDIYKKMRLQEDAIIINQTDYEDVELFNTNNGCIKFISSKERGLAKSRNLAIRSSDADVCLFTDNDVVFKDGYVEKIKAAYRKYPEADIIAFTVTTDDDERTVSKLKTGEVNRVMSMKVSSVQISFKREIVEKNNLFLNEKFGAGSDYFNSGEENIFLYQAIKKGLKMYYVDEEIASVSFEESTWYGKDIEKDLLTKGAMFYTMSSFLYPLYNIQFILRKRWMYSEALTFFEALKKTFEGSSKAKILIKNNIKD